MTSARESVVQPFREDFHAKLTDALATAGYEDRRALLRAAHDGVLDVERMVISRYYDKKEIPTLDKPQSRANIEALAALTARPDHLVAEWEAMLTRIGDALSSSRVATQDGLAQRWYAVIPSSPDRPRMSVDAVTVDQSANGTMTGSLERQWPPTPGLSWRFEGRTTREGVFYVFHPTSNSNTRSTGVVALQAHGRQRREALTGHYMRIDDDGDSRDAMLATRIYEWHHAIPTALAPQLAIIDLDNTLRPGYAIVGWMKDLTERGQRGARSLLSSIQASIARYDKDLLTHDELASYVAVRYSTWESSQKDPHKLLELADLYVADRGADTLHDFARPLVDLLAARGFAPILVTGAPYPVAAAFAKHLGIEVAIGAGDVGARMAQTGLPGLACDGSGRSKRAIVDELRLQGRQIVVGVGDSSSDLPFLSAAQLSVVVGKKVRRVKAAGPDVRIDLDNPTNQWASVVEGALPLAACPPLTEPV